MSANKQGAVLFDLDGTLAVYDRWRGIQHIGEPVPAMIELVKEKISEGYEVRIFTARASINDPCEKARVCEAIEAWCAEHIGVVLPITATKTFDVVALYDDRAVQVVHNTGRVVEDVLDTYHASAFNAAVPTHIFATFSAAARYITVSQSAYDELEDYGRGARDTLEALFGEESQSETLDFLMASVDKSHGINHRKGHVYDTINDEYVRVSLAHEKRPYNG